MPPSHPPNATHTRAISGNIGNTPVPPAISWRKARPRRELRRKRTTIEPRGATAHAASITARPTGASRVDRVMGWRVGFVVGSMAKRLVCPNRSELKLQSGLLSRAASKAAHRPSNIPRLGAESPTKPPRQKLFCEIRKNIRNVVDNPGGSGRIRALFRLDPWA